MDSGQLMSLVREAAAELEKKGEEVFPEFRVEGSKWRRGETYLFVWDIGGTRIFHGATPEIEGADVRYMRDVHGKPVGQMLIDTASSRQGEGWVHYYWPKPGSVFPGWKSTFLKRVTFPSGQKCFVGCGLYDMKVEKPFVTDAVEAACALVESEGRSAFAKIRSKAGRFVFLDTYVFVMGRDGVEYVNYAFPSLEGRNLMDCRDAGGKFGVREEIEVAMNRGAGWVDGFWPKPGEATSSRKQTYVRKVEHNGETFIVGSGIYLD
jgi:signal transduction histidine kinase